MKSFIKWVGGKTRIVDVIMEFIPSFDYYIEPFIGGGSLFFAIKPKNATISDVNANLINCYLVIRDNLSDLIDSLKKLNDEYNSTDSHEIRTEMYNKKRIEYNDIKIRGLCSSIPPSGGDFDNILCASLFIFLNKTAFNGLYRENSKGGFNVPHGKYKKPCILDEKNLIEISTYFNECNITIKCCSYIEIYKEIMDLKDKYKSICIYNDPPYYQSDTSKFVSYTVDKFGIKEQEELRNIVLKYKDDATIMVSNSKCDGVLELYKEFSIKDIKVHRSISSKKSTRGDVEEVLIVGGNAPYDPLF